MPADSAPIRRISTSKRLCLKGHRQDGEALFSSNEKRSQPGSRMRAATRQGVVVAYADVTIPRLSTASRMMPATVYVSDMNNNRSGLCCFRANNATP